MVSSYSIASWFLDLPSSRIPQDICSPTLQVMVDDRGYCWMSSHFLQQSLCIHLNLVTERSYYLEKLQIKPVPPPSMELNNKAFFLW